MPDLGRELRRIEIPGAAVSEDRAWRLLDAAYAERGTERAPMPGWPRRRLRWLAASMLTLIVGAAVAWTPAGAAVREWIGDAIDDVGEPDARPVLTHLPAPGSLLVQSNAGIAVVHEDGSRRILGDFDEAGWSPHGLYVAAADGRQLLAISADGELRRSVTRGRISDPVWSPNEGYRVAYRSGDQLRVIWGDGTNDAAIGGAAGVAAAWQPRTGSRNVLAYADRNGRVKIVDTDSGQVLARGGSFDVPVELDWTRDGSRLLVLYRDSMQVVDGDGRALWRSKFPSDQTAAGAVFVPGTETVAALLRGTGPHSASRIVLATPRDGDVVKRTIFTGTGRLRGLVPAPDGRELMVGWPKADQWLFIPTLRNSHIDAVDNIRRQFADGSGAGFPRVDGWCCQNRAGD
jgi:hypothetical protein